ncbi:MAG: hypothetical protein QGG25_18840, partial [Phycisphaerae bacterium]|nr:hypothetical protein [Phycisphaerae bacterium]
KVDGVDTLTFDVGAVRKLTFQSTEITGAAGGAVTFDIDGDVWLTKTGGIDAGGAVLINKTGSGQMILTEGLTNLGASPMLDVTEGALALGRAGLLAGVDVQIGGGGGGGLTLSSPLGTPVETYTAPFQFNGDASIVAGKLGLISQNGATVIYDRDINAGANALTLGSTDNYTLKIGDTGAPRNVTAQSLDISEGNVNISGQTTVADAISVSDATASFGGTTSAGDLNISGDSVVVLSGQATVTGATNVSGTSSLKTSSGGDSTAGLSIVSTASVDATNPIKVTDIATIGSSSGGTLEISMSAKDTPLDSFTLTGADLADYTDTPNIVTLQGGTTKIEQRPSGDMSVRLVRVTGDQINDTNEADGILDGTLVRTIAEDVTVVRDTINMYQNANTFTGGDPYPNGKNDASQDDLTVEAVAEFAIPAGDWTIAFGSDDGGLLQFDSINFTAGYNENATGRALTPNDGEVYFGAPRGHGWTAGEFTVPAGGVTTMMRSLMFERGGGDSFEIAIRSGSHGNAVNNTDWVLLQDGALGWTIPAAPITVILPSTTVVASVNSRLELSTLVGDTVAFGEISTHKNAILTIDSESTGIALSNLTMYDGSALLSTKTVGAGSAVVTVTVSDTLSAGDGVGMVGDYENDDWSTDLTLADGATFEWTFGGGGQNYLNVEGGFVNIAGGLTLRLKGGAGSASGEDVSLIKSLFGVVIDPEQVTVEAPDGWSWGTLPSGAPDMGFNGQYLVLRNLTAFAVTLPGDANGDGDVNDADLALFEAQFGEAGAGQTADFDGD